MDGYSLRITPEAEADIDDAYEYIAYHLENPQAAFELTDGIYAAIEGLSLMHPVSISDLEARADEIGRGSLIRSQELQRFLLHKRTIACRHCSSCNVQSPECVTGNAEYTCKKYTPRQFKIRSTICKWLHGSFEN